MPISHQVSLGSQTLHWLAFPTRLIVRDVVQNCWLKDKKPSVDPALTDLGLLGELDDPVTVEDQTAEASRWPYGGSCRQLTMASVELD